MPYKEPQTPEELSPFDRKVLRSVFNGKTQAAAAKLHHVPSLRVHMLVNSPGGKQFLATLEAEEQVRAKKDAEKLINGGTLGAMINNVSKEAVVTLVQAMRRGKTMKDRVNAAERIISLDVLLQRQQQKVRTDQTQQHMSDGSAQNLIAALQDLKEAGERNARDRARGGGEELSRNSAQF